MSHAVRGLPPGRLTITDYSDPREDGRQYHYDVGADGSVVVGTDERLDLLLGVYPDAVASEVAPAPPAVEASTATDDGGEASTARTTRRRSTT